MNSSIYFPAEWELQQAVMCTWPDKQTDWAKDLPLIELFYRDFVVAAATFQPIWVICRDKSHQTYIEQILQNHLSADTYPIVFLQCPFDDTWVRDYGPLTIFENDAPIWLDFRFNGWGGKFSAPHDDKIVQALQAQYFQHIQLKTFPVILEGGAIESDGLGTILTTPCLFTDTRNPALSRLEIEKLLQENFGMQKLWVIENGYLAGDDTDGHIDMLARFCQPHVIAYTACDNPDDEHYESLKKMEAELEVGVTLSGDAYELIPLPIPAAIFDDENQRLPASYANFLIINGAVLMPTYDDPNDAIALARLREAMPNRQIIGIPCRTLIRQHGSLHCATMQVPAFE